MDIKDNSDKVLSIMYDLHNCNCDHSDNHEGFHEVQGGQQPQVIYVGCSDSRVDNPFNKNFNKIFAVENAGNRIDSDNLSASATYAAYHIPETTILYIVGHTGCGAVTGATTMSDEVLEKESSDLKGYLKKMQEYLFMHKEKVEGFDVPEGMDEKIFKNTLYCEINVDYQVKVAMEKYKELIETKKLVVIGGMYDIHNIYPEGQGRVHIINVNGETDVLKIKESEFLKDVDKSNVMRFMK